MKLVMICLDRMSGFMAKRFLHAGQPVVGYDRSQAVTDEMAYFGGPTPVHSLNEIVGTLAAIRHESGGHSILSEGEKLK